MNNSSYDQVPYLSLPFPQTHPDRLATLATLLGVPHPPLRGCRVLELGCAAGGNLIPLAEQLSECEFVGVDLSTVQIAQGQAIVDALGYRNVRLVAASIVDIDASYGEFDFIICHGVYSWVPTEIQETILRVCRERLTNHGIVYISYNTLPGWRMRGMIRDLMQQFSIGIEDPLRRVGQARTMLAFLAQAVPANEGAYSTLLRGELDLLQKLPDSYIFHEHLEEVNEPIYFREFVVRAARHGLKYLAEADFSTMLAQRFPPEVAATVSRIAPDIVGQEQLLDFLRNRTFRQTLLIRDSAKIERTIPLFRIDSLRMASSLKPVAETPNVTATLPEIFQSESGATVTTSLPLAKMAITALSKRWPSSLSWEELLGEVRELGRGKDMDVGTMDILRADLLQCFTNDLITLHVSCPAFTFELSDRPLASPLARWQARTSSTVTTLRHNTVTLDAYAQKLLTWLDGATSQTDLSARWNATFPDLAPETCTQALTALMRASLLRS